MSENDFIRIAFDDPWADDGISTWEDYPEGTEIIAYGVPEKPADWCGTPVPGGSEDTRGPRAVLRDDGVAAFRAAMIDLGYRTARIRAFLDLHRDADPVPACMPAFDDSLVTDALFDSLDEFGLLA
ncbi:MAG: hypothetical protein HQL40_18120 [Alphaproteobacteria bacterium]|nr:hypothetical protein [Alphaproteobacteria bacterium]MBF0335533.1 hypothetical protein [Alphaproteobacteria bacterium]